MSERNSNISTKNNSTNSLIHIDFQKNNLLNVFISNLELMIEENKKLKNYLKIIHVQKKCIFIVKIPKNTFIKIYKKNSRIY